MSEVQTRTGRSFTCDACGETFPMARSDEEARAEAEEIFGEHVWADPITMLCEDCWKKIIGF
jgi:hypothetical protein